jgi:eukaryotic-like serine/threonine-protein kinase
VSAPYLLWLDFASSSTVAGVSACQKCGATRRAAERFCEQCGSSFEARVSITPAPLASPASALIGRVFAGKYKVEKLLGEGGMGCVYLAEQALGTGSRRVALKTLHAELSRDPKIRARFEREAGTVARLEHPNSIHIFDYGATDDGLLYIVMEYAPGKTLADVLVEGPLEPARALKVITQVAGALTEAHALGIVHRDLKPDNIMLMDKAGQKDFIKVLDFGIAKSRDEEAKGNKLTQQGTVLGTPPYMSPEQFTGAALDARSDVYSLGVVAYEMLAGVLPFEADTAFEWATQHMTSPPRLLETTVAGAAVPALMRDAVYRALRKLPEERFASVDDFVSALSQSQEGVPRVAKTAMEQAAAPTSPRPGGTLMGDVAPVAPYAAPATSQSYGHHHPTPGPARAMQPYPVHSAGYTASPVRVQEGGGSRKGLIAFLAIAALACIGAIVYSVILSEPERTPVPIVVAPAAPPVVVPAAQKPALDPSAPAPATVAPLTPAVAPLAPPAAPAKPTKPNTPPPSQPKPQVPPAQPAPVPTPAVPPIPPYVPPYVPPAPPQVTPPAPTPVTDPCFPVVKPGFTQFCKSRGR